MRPCLAHRRPRRSGTGDVVLVESQPAALQPANAAPTRVAGPVRHDAPVPARSFRLLPVDAERASRAARVYEALRDGNAPVETRRPFPGLTANVPTITDVRHPAVGTITAVVKPPAELAAQEAFAFDIARRLGIGHHYAQIAPRPDGSALIEVVDGQTWRKAGIGDVADLDRAYRAAWDAHHPALPAAERAQRARVDRELVQFVDWLTAQGDRSPNNGLWDDRRVAVQLFDHGRIGAETPWNKLRPWLPYPYMGPEASGRVRAMHLSEESRAVISANLSPADIASSHRQLLRGAPRNGMSVGQGAMLRYLGSDDFLRRMVARHESALATGTMEYIGGGTRTSIMNAMHMFNRVVRRH